MIYFRAPRHRKHTHMHVTQTHAAFNVLRRSFSTSQLTQPMLLHISKVKSHHRARSASHMRSHRALRGAGGDRLGANGACGSLNPSPHAGVTMSATSAFSSPS
eukprot:5845513-Amphidinium_carterae.1